ncbi:MAG: Sec-independent protein translocase protein TatB, partial [Pseudonocardiaceae bacterium]
MFNMGPAELVVLAVVGMFILGPERLPSAVAWLGKTVHQVREYATGAREQLRSELGPEFDELRKPLEELRGLRGFNSGGFNRRGFSPRSALTRHLFDDLDDKPFDWTKPNGFAAPTGLGTLVTR